MMEGEFKIARDILRRVCKELKNTQFPSWFAHQAIAATSWVNYAAAILVEHTAAGHTETISLLDASLERIPNYAGLYRQLASCLLVDKQFPRAMSALHCALSISVC